MHLFIVLWSGKFLPLFQRKAIDKYDLTSKTKPALHIILILMAKVLKCFDVLNGC